jgi:hypothetical protein
MSAMFTAGSKNMIPKVHCRVVRKHFLVFEEAFRISTYIVLKYISVIITV